MLTKYNELSLFLSERSKLGVKKSSGNIPDYQTVKYNAKENRLDSPMETSSDTKQKEGSSSRNLLSYDIDENNSLWVYSYPDTTIRHYDRDGKFRSEIVLETEDLKMLPEGLTEIQWKGNRFYGAFNLHAIQDKIVITYKTRYTDKVNNSNVIAVYTKDGEFVKRESVPHMFYKIGDALFYWKKEGGWWCLMKWDI